MVTIGVTGHRFLTQVDKITAGVDEALRRIEAAFDAPPMAVISLLAQGADRLVVQRVFARWPAAELIVPLPLPQADYVTDFPSPESRDVFLDLLSRADRVITLPPSPRRDEAYAAAGRYVLDHCDVLLAVWDGKPAQGTGGTTEIVAEARRRGLPLAWVHAGNREPGTQRPVSLGRDQGKVTFERFPTTHPLRDRHHGPRRLR